MRSISAGMISASLSEVVRPILLVELSFASGFVRVNSSDRTINNGGTDFAGVGTLGKVSQLREGGDLQADGAVFELSGVPTDLVAIVLGEQYQGRPAKIWIAFLDAAYAVITNPVLVFSGRIDTMEIDAGAEARITVTAESRLVDWERPRIKQYTDADQQALYPGDLGLQFVARMSEVTLNWGGETAGQSGPIF